MCDQTTEDCLDPTRSKPKTLKLRIFSTFYTLQMSFIPSQFIHTIVALCEFIQLILVPISMNTDEKYWRPLSIYSYIQYYAEASYDPLNMLILFDSVNLYLVTTTIACVFILTSIIIVDFIFQFLKHQSQITSILGCINYLSSSALFLPILRKKNLMIY